MPTITQTLFERATDTLSDRLDLACPMNAPAGFRHLTVAAIGMAVLILGMMAIDTRMLGDEPVWLKPFKFAVSFALLFATLWAVTSRFTERWQRNVFVAMAVLASAAAFFFEMAYIGAQAARAEPSHFNESSAFHETMYSLMGLGASALMASIAAIGVAAWLDRGARLGDAARIGILAGFLGTVVLTLLVAGELAGNGGRYIGLPTEGGPRLPVLGWSMEVGDLRPAHFLSLHMMQAIPLLGLLADRNGLARSAVLAGVVLYAALTLVVFFQALQGLPVVSA
ncbi:hypothetical protein HKCCSP123_18820 [Rhodobacterales bacterium HKCCSP123]|nr:hypothetical protein [Rhodobacterales bacterium HKCCSP123]